MVTFPLVKDGYVKYKDLTGARFGLLIVKERVIAPLGHYRHGRHWWRCECDCGGMHFVLTNNLCRGHVRSCGCLSSRRSLFRKRNSAILERRETTTETTSQI